MKNQSKEREREREDKGRESKISTKKIREKNCRKRRGTEASLGGEKKEGSKEFVVFVSGLCHRLCCMHDR